MARAFLSSVVHLKRAARRGTHTSMVVPDRVPTTPRQRANLPAWMREPLLHFIVLGAILFAMDYLIAGRTDGPHTITVDASVDQRERDLFKEAHGRAPNEDELYSLRR